MLPTGMKDTPNDNLVIVLNKLHALQSCKIVTLRGIAKAIGQPEQRISEWVMQRKYRPSGESAIRLLAFCASATTSICFKRELWFAYRTAYNEACIKFPVNGKE